MCGSLLWAEHGVQDWTQVLLVIPKGLWVLIPKHVILVALLVARLLTSHKR